MAAVVGGSSNSSSLSGSGSGASSNGGFPLRTNFFRSLPLGKEQSEALYTLAKQNATACLNQSFNDQWRYVPPEKDGTQIRKDTSNMAASFRLVRAATVLRCQEHEVNQVISNTSTESWREFMRKCFGKYYVDTIILHAVANPPLSTTQRRHPDKRDGGEHQRQQRQHTPRAGADTAGSGRQSHWLKGGIAAADDSSRAAGSFQSDVDDAAFAHDGDDLETGSTTGTTNQDEESAATRCEQADEFVTAKWGVFDTGLTGKRDLCLVDYLSLAFIPNTDKTEQVHLWCFTSADGDSVGCMELKDTHNVARSRLTKLGVFWRKLSEEETEVIICGSFPSKHSHAVSSLLLASLGRLQGIIEDLRLSSQLYIHRSTWVKDKERASCHLCMRNFHALRRKHHCRKCGEVICSDCSTLETIDLPAIGYSKLRLCKVCGIRARSTPLKRLDKSNVFDRLVRARSLSNIHAGSPFSRASYAEAKHDAAAAGGHEGSHSGSLDGMFMTPLHGNQALVGLDARTHSSSGYSSSASNHNNDPDDAFDELADSMHTHGGGSSSCSSVVAPAAIHPISRSTHPEDFDDFIGGRSLKTQLTAMEQKKQKAGSNSNMFDLLCELACQTLNCPIASVCIVDSEGTFVRSAAGLDANAGLDDELALFIDKVMGSTPAIVLDANVDKQAQQVFARRGAAPEIRFFAGCPIYSRTNKKLGYVCVADLTKRDTIGASCAFTMERLATLAGSNTAVHAGRSDTSNAALVGRVYEVFDETPPVPMYATPTSLPSSSSASSSSSSASSSSSSSSASSSSSSSSSSTSGAAAGGAHGGNAHHPHAGAPRYGDYSAGYYEAQERMKKLLLKSYHTQQQLASGSSPTTQAMSPPLPTSASSHY
ncbi:hypothetical protein PybrP1_007940 [[Pythium] brassicae (nom. inval.)]|nr:hypothetical protein PybrP1_007940 [[Pythium] brassicae (nom. inval.)]